MNIILENNYPKIYEFIEDVDHIYVTNNFDIGFSSRTTKEDALISKELIIDKISKYLPKLEYEHTYVYEERVLEELKPVTRKLFRKILELKEKVKRRKRKNIYPINLLGIIIKEHFETKEW